MSEEEKNITSTLEKQEEEQKEGEEESEQKEGEEEIVSSGEEEEEEVEEEEEDIEPVDPGELLALGKKCLAAGDATNALECIQEACAALAERHGQVSKELADPYYLYGRALLEVAREKNTVFGQGVPGGNTDNSDAPPPVTSSSSSSAGGSSSNGGGVASSSSGPGPAANGSETGSGRGDHEGEGHSGDQGAGQDGDQEEEEESDLKLAWEILELARIICQREKGREYQLKLSDVSLLLGEVGLECDQYSQAITDFQASLRLRMFLLEPIDRRIAEVHFHLGLAYMLDKQGDQAVTAYQSAKSTLLKRAAYLRGQMQEQGGESTDLAEEVAELEDVIKDVESKVTDAQELQKVLEEKAKDGAGEDSSEVQFSSSFDKPDDALSNKPSQIAVKNKAPVNDISHLIRKRKTDSDSSSEKGGVMKKMKLENGSSSGAVEEPALVQDIQPNNGQ